jgi:hypothetical protein
MENFTFSIVRDKFAFAISPEMPLSWAAFGLETGVLWFLGRAIFRFQLSRYPGTNPDQNFSVLPLEIRRGFEWSNIVTLKQLHEEKLFPQKLARSWQDIGEEETTFSLHSNADFPNQTLGNLAYGLADITVDLFKRGAKTVRAQYSMERTEFWADIGMSSADITQFMSLKFDDYEPHETVSSLPP